MRRSLSLVALCLAATLPAQTPVIPATPAGAALRAWLDAFNSGDAARLDAYYQRYQPELSAASQLGFRRQVGGFELLSIERAEPRHVEFLLKERNSATTGFGVLEVAADSAGRVTDFPLWAIGERGTVDDIRVDRATQARVVAGAAAMLDSFYVFPDVARRMGDTLRARLARGAYERETNGVAFALRLVQDLRAVSRDKHLGVDYFPRALPPDPPSDAKPSADDEARRKRSLAGSNCSFVRVERLAGNVGYLKFDGFAPPEPCAETVAAAMTFVAGTQGLIVDLRENRGGSPGMVALVSSYLFDRRTHLNDLWTRSTGKTQEYWTQDSVAGRRYGGEKPVIVLTSAQTFSAAEELTYDLKALGRATVVGETTGGGAHPVSGHRLDDHFVVVVPVARAVNPTTHTNWEGVGIEPDVKVSAADALAAAQERLRRPPPPRP